MFVTLSEQDYLVEEVMNIVQMAIPKSVFSKIKKRLNQILMRLLGKINEQEQQLNEQKHIISDKDRVIREQSETILLLTRDKSESRQTQHAHSETETTAVDCEKPAALTNDIFREKLPEGELDLDKLWEWIGLHFLKRLTNQYDWFALWRVLKDKRLIRNTQLSTHAFVEQMRKWYPEYKDQCKDGNVNLYRTGYLGKTEFSNWRQAIFEQTMKKKQRKEGYERLEELCRDLMTELRREDLVKP